MSCASQRYGPATSSEVIPSTPQPAFEPRSTIIRPSIAVNVPSLRAPTLRWDTCAEAGFVAWKSSLRVSTSRTGRRSASAAPAASGSTSANLPPKAPPSGSAIDADPLEREVERARELVPRHERALRARRHDERAGRLEPGRADLRLDVRLVDPRRPERALGDHVAAGERRRDVSVLAGDAIEHVGGELLGRVVLLPVVDACVDRLEVAALLRLLDDAGERRTRLHRGLDVDDRGERLVLDDDDLGAVLGRRLGLRDDERDRLSGEDDLLARERLGRAVGAGRREREVRRQEDGDDTGYGQRGLLVDASDARVRLGREDGTRMQQAVDVAVGREPGRAGDLVRRVDARPRDADQRVAHRVLRSRARVPRPERARRRPPRARAGTRRRRSGRRRCPPRRSASRGSPGGRTNGVAPTPVSATVSPSGVTSAAAPASAKPDAGCSTACVRRARARRREGDDDVGHELLRPSAVMNGPTSASASASSRSPAGERS